MANQKNMANIIGLMEVILKDTLKMASAMDLELGKKQKIRIHTKENM